MTKLIKFFHGNLSKVQNLIYEHEHFLEMLARSLINLARGYFFLINLARGSHPLNVF
jgi:hypothetical protein